MKRIILLSLGLAGMIAGAAFQSVNSGLAPRDGFVYIKYSLNDIEYAEPTIQIKECLASMCEVVRTKALVDVQNELKKDRFLPATEFDRVDELATALKGELTYGHETGKYAYLIAALNRATEYQFPSQTAFH